MTTEKHHSSMPDDSKPSKNSSQVILDSSAPLGAPASTRRVCAQKTVTSKEVPGKLHVSNNCLSDLAGYAALECYGVVGMAALDSQDGVAHLLPTHRLRRGVDVSLSEDGVTVDLHVILEQGVNVRSVSENLKGAVSFLFSTIAQIDDACVNVHVEGLKQH